MKEYMFNNKLLVIFWLATMQFYLDPFKTIIELIDRNSMPESKTTMYVDQVRVNFDQTP